MYRLPSNMSASALATLAASTIKILGETPIIRQIFSIVFVISSLAFSVNRSLGMPSPSIVQIGVLLLILTSF